MKFTIEISQEDILAIIARAQTSQTQNIVATVGANAEVIAVKEETRGRPPGSKNKKEGSAAAAPASVASAPAPIEKPMSVATAPVAAPAQASGQVYTLQDVSKALTEKAQKSGDRDGVLAILRKYAPTVSQVKPEQYAALMADLKGESAPVPAAAGDESW